MEAPDMRLEDIARSVLARYDVEPVKIQVIQQGGVKTVWKVIAGKGAFCLKRLKQTEEKALFSVEAQRYIKSKGGNVPGVILNKSHEAITDHNNELFVLYEWIEGKQLNFDKKEDFMAAMEGLAHFHKFSKGYQPPESARVSTKIAKWPDQYRSMLSKLNEWKSISYQKAGTAVYDAYLEWVDPIMALGEQAIRYLESSNYGSLSSPDSQAVVLCHQDYGKGNALLTPGGVWILDMDGVTFELAARDLRKIILKTMENQGKWQEGSMKEIVSWYEKANPLSMEEKKMIYIDTLFPHSFFGTVKNQFIKNKPVKAMSIERIGKLEMSKENSLKSLIGGKDF
jgi:spore coat protein I